MKDSADGAAVDNSQGWPLLHFVRRALSRPAAAGPPRTLVGTPVPSELALDGLRVLVADDNPVNLMLASEMLAQFGIEPLLAADGAEAAALAAEFSIDLVLMDLQMPVMDGLGATREIRRLEQVESRPRVPVVAYTSLYGTWAQLRSQGFDDLLEKPCEVLAMRACLVHWCLPRGYPTHQGARAADTPH